MTGSWVGVTAFLVTLVATPAVIVLARRTGIVDHPGALKPQTVAVPYLGGLAVWAGTMVGVLAGRPGVAIPLTGALVLGVADDRLDLAPGLRLVGQVAIGVTIGLTIPVHLPTGLALPLIGGVSVLVINGVNLIDGLDLLAGGVAAVAAVGFAVALHGSGRQAAVAVGASSLAFLVFNRPPARVYLGDGGSYLLGTALAVLLAYSWGPGVPTAIGMATLVLVARGWSRKAASLTYIAVEIMLAAGAVVAVHLVSLPTALVVDLAGAGALVVAGLATGALVPDPGARA